jgi:hypothetical protein
MLETLLFVLSNLIGQEPWDTLSTWFASISSNVPILAGAFIVGAIGSLAYYAALKLGYAGGNQRDGILKNFASFTKSYGVAVAGFLFIGGAVATAFQAAQMETFTPVQSFVLGVTWPMIVAQYAAREPSGPPPEVNALRNV